MECERAPRVNHAPPWLQLRRSAGFICRLAGLALLLSAPHLQAQIPVSGVPVPELSSLDTEMTVFMEANEISAGSLSVMNQGVVIFHRVYGWQDRARQKPLRPDAIFRIASVTKPFTAAAIRKLVDDGLLTLNTKVFSLGTPGAGVLDFTPFGSPDPRLGDITIEHLLQHYGGWDRDIAGDLTYMEKTIATAMEVSSPPGRENTVRYTMGQPLQYAPGSTYAYSNIGYLLLGLIIEEVSGMDYRTFLQTHVIGPEGSTSSDWLLGRTFADDQDAREPFYDYPTFANNVFYPASSDVSIVEWPYGGFDFEARTGQGRIVTSGLVILRQLNRYQIAGADIGGPRPAPGSWRWNHVGSLPGSTSLARQRGDGISYAVLFNKRPTSGSYSSTMRAKLDTIFDEGDLTLPATDITQSKVTLPAAIEFSLEPPMLAVETKSGQHYQWQRSEDLVEWTDYLDPFIGSDARIERSAPSPTAKSEFFRLVIRQ